jgi:hypothetical protein
MCTPQCVSRESVDPMVLTTPTHSAPRSRQYRSARIVSAVSPLWLRNTHTSSRKIGVLRSKKSLASSTLTGISVSSSKIARVARHEW